MTRTPPRPLPDDLVRRPLLRRDALGAGLSAHELRGPHWSRPLRGLYRWGGARADVADRIAEVAALLPPGAAIGGWASLWWQGAADLDGRADLRVDRVSALPRSRAAAPRTREAALPGLTPVLVCLGPGARIRPRPEIDISRRKLLEEDVLEIDGIPFVRPARSAVDLIGRQPPELGLASIDAAIRGGATTAGSVQRYLDHHPGVHGRPQILRVVGLADGRARSRPESVMRWIWVVLAGLPPPLVNAEICDSQGILLGIPDLLDLEAGLVGECDGAHHRELHQHTSDNIREERFEDHNLEVVRATSIDLWPRRRELVQRILAKHRRGNTRDRSRDAWYLRRAA
ncbi:MAG: hypothetical protein LH461_09160 [Spirochaetaceae bacterium]|nr:hypothetical protein [Spirochaetaceae bacterium]